MWPRWIRVSALLVGAWVVSACAVGCSAKDTTAPKPTEHVNDTKPNADARILSQSMFGALDQRSSIYDLRAGNAGSYRFRGLYNSGFGFGTIGAGGAVSWFESIPFDPRDLVSLPPTSFVPDGIVGVGWTNDASAIKGYASLLSANGTTLSQVLFASDSSNMWLYGVTQEDDSTFIACGGEQQSGVTHPLIALLHLRRGGFLERGKTMALQGVAGGFAKVVKLPSATDQIALAVVASNGVVRSVGKFTAPWPGLDAFAVTWSHDIVITTGSEINIKDLRLAGGNLYVTGDVDDNRKAAPSGGGLWNSGFVASFTTTGDPRWSTTVGVTKQTEQFYSSAIGTDAVYAVGIAAEYQYSTEIKDEFGYGLISKLDLNTGQVIANFTLGDERYQAGFNAATLTTSGLVCAGWIGYDVGGGPLQAWLATVNVAGTTATAATATTPAGAIVHAAAPERGALRGPERGRDRGPR